MIAAARALRLDWPALTRLAIGTLLILAIVAGPSLYGRLTAGGRVDPALKGATGPVNVQVVGSFQPGAHQQAELSRFGVFGGIRGHAIVLFNVSPQALGELEDLYWIDAIKPFSRT